MKIASLKWSLGAICAVSASAATAGASDIARIAQAIQSQVSQGQFMGTVVVARNGKILLEKSYGKANLEWQVPNSPDTRFRLASMTKQFTAASILLLQEQGKLKIEDPVSKYMPGAPSSWNAVTLFNLLTHTSGIHELTALPDFDATEPFPTTPDKLVARFMDLPLDFAPGTAFHYSNSGYILLGYLIEKITGQTYSQYVHDNIFVPLGMKDSGYDSNTRIIDRHAEGYAPKAGGFEIAGYIDMTIPFSAGGLYSTSEDLLRWETGLYGGKLLSPKSLARMTAPLRRDPSKRHYAFGLDVDSDPHGNRVIWHCGAIEGFGGCISHVPVENLEVIVLSNVEGKAALAILMDILKIEGHEPPTPIAGQ
jgi:CubicO group peptidase (beta-lactamase class C family)